MPNKLTARMTINPMEIAFFIGRIIVGLYWLMGAVNHFTQVKSMVPYAKMKNVPLAEIAVP